MIWRTNQRVHSAFTGVEGDWWFVVKPGYKPALKGHVCFQACDPLNPHQLLRGLTHSTAWPLRSTGNGGVSAFWLRYYYKHSKINDAIKWVTAFSHPPCVEQNTQHSCRGVWGIPMIRSGLQPCSWMPTWRKGWWGLSLRLGMRKEISQ